MSMMLVIRVQYEFQNTKAMGPSKHRVLSREEEVELSQSKKKVKDVHHARFNNGPSEGGQP